jgi:uncharacterized protein (DUF2141 family)
MGALSCHGGSNSSSPDMSAVAAPQAVEWVGFHTELPMSAADFTALASQLFGANAQAGNFLAPRAISPGIWLSSEAETAAPDQSRIRLAFDGSGSSDGMQRTLAVAPASFAIGQIFLTATTAAVASMHQEEQAEAGSGERFYLEYRVSSTQGGTLSFGLRGEKDAYTLVVDIASPRTHLDPTLIGQAAAAPGATDSVAGTVWFHMSRDEFRFFSDHAYGKGATSKQNFTDFHLMPFDWLRLTVEPHLDQQFVHVGFEVVDGSGKRTPVAAAPASVLAGATFQSLVDRNMTTMMDAEAQKAGSSTPWQAPFYYDSPGTGGVVQVVASGEAGRFQIAYAIESPQHKLTDVPFNAYMPVQIAPPDPNATASCDKLGDPSIVAALQGVLDMTFTASTTVTTSPQLKGPLVGTIYCSIFNASDVTASGPTATAMSLQDFQIDNANLSGATPVKFTSKQLVAGNYQVLCFQDLDGNMDASKGDPVTLPIGSYPLACNTNPTDVEFALLDP